MTQPDAPRPDYRRLLRGPLTLLAAVILARFALEAAGVSLDVTRFLSVSVVSGLAMIYLGAVAPLRGVTRLKQLAFVALVLCAWLGGWTALALVISGLLQLPGSHFAHHEPGTPLYPHFAFHVLEHVAIIPFAVLPTLGVMAIPYALHRWPVTVAPAAVLGGLVVLRFASEAMGLAPTTAAAWSSSVGILLGALYLGGIGQRMAVVSPRQLLAPALALGWVWRLWIFLAAVVTALLGYETHFFDPVPGRLASRLLQSFAVDVVGVGFAAGLMVWGIAVWAARVTR